MKVAIYPGSFNPWHEGHRDVVRQALRVFDKVIIAVGVNPEKPIEDSEEVISKIKSSEAYGLANGCLELIAFKDLFAYYIKEVNLNERKIHAVIRGLRNAQDLEYETTQLYWNQDLGIDIPSYFVICSRELRHVSSSAIRAIEKIGGPHDTY